MWNKAILVSYSTLFMCCDNFITLLLFLTLLLLLFIFIIYLLLLLLHFYYLELYLTIKFFEKSSPFLLLTLISLVIPKAVQSRRERRKERIITLISRKKKLLFILSDKDPQSTGAKKNLRFQMFGFFPLHSICFLSLSYLFPLLCCLTLDTWGPVLKQFKPQL